MNSPVNARQRSATPVDPADLDGARDESPVSLRRRRAAALPQVQPEAAGAEAAANLRRRRPAAVLPLTGAAPAETPAVLRLRRSAALNPGHAAPADPREGEEVFGLGGGADGAPEARQQDAFPAPAAEPEPARKAPWRRGGQVKSIFNWLKAPGDDVVQEEKPQPLMQRIVVREFWQSNIKTFNRLFLALPIIAAAGYLYLIAPDGYQVDTVLSIRNPSNNVAMGGASMAGMAASLGSTGQGYAERAIDESFAVVNFIRSREAFNELERSMKLSERFMTGNIDWFHRMSPTANYEARYKNYLNHISVSYSDIEGQITLTTDAYDPETSFAMAKELARISERLVNQFNERARTDMIKLAQVQMTEAEDGLRGSMLALTDLQIKNGMLDPAGEAESYTNIISSLREQVAVKRAELGALTSTSAPDSPRAVEIRNMLGSLETQIRTEQNRLTGRTDALAPLIGKFKLLNIDVQLAQQKYNSAAAMLQSALLQSEHQKLYVVNVVSPTPPLESTIPKRFFILLCVVGVTFLAWLIARLILASIRDHSV
ncbi:hypothetical protein V5F53_16035 [Xanthobacter sp. V4C-4]|uniref:hypothetical protein n=1 Tax=Xanthobacter cornucopiae TaxID=3119924 RepID=UPI0037289B84